MSFKKSTLKQRENFYKNKFDINKLNKKFLKYKIDPWVSYGEIRLIRLLYSLNSLCSRICTPISLQELKNFNPNNKKYLIPF